MIGQTVSHYRIVDRLGGGSMGTVYKARDTDLQRFVALKFLTDEIARDPMALARFKREARATSALNHPGICTIYEIGQDEAGRPFIAMELLEGITLKQMMAARQLEVTALIDLAIQIADALDAAHLRGIIHRDIKPANIMVIERGRTKLLDFGIARELPDIEPESPAFASAETASFDDQHLTGPHSVLGTPAYMSPEQVSAGKLDTRSDLFSFGVVLYEMASGRLPFRGDSFALIVKAIHASVPLPITRANTEVPEELERIILKALEKDKELRYQHAAEMKADLQRLRRDMEADRTLKAELLMEAKTERLVPSPSASPQQVSRAPRGRGLWLAGSFAVLLILLCVWVGLKRFPPKHASPAPRGMLVERELTHNTPENRVIGAAISPDGNKLAYIDVKGLHLSGIVSGEVHDLPLPDEVQSGLWTVAWLPNGEQLVLGTESDGVVMLWLTSVYGGAPRLLRTDGRYPAVSPDGKFIAFISGSGHEISIMDANGEEPRKLLSSDAEEYRAPVWSPSGKRIAYIVSRQQPADAIIRTISLDGGEPTQVAADPEGERTLLWSPDGWLIFARADGLYLNSPSNLWKIRADPNTGRSSEEPVRVTDSSEFAPYSPTISADGRRLAVIKLHAREDVFAGSLRHNGTQMEPPVRLTESESMEYASGWSLDSKSLLLWSNRSGRNQIYRRVLGEDTLQPIIQSPDDENGAEMSPDGHWILYWAIANNAGPDANARLMRIPASGGTSEHVLDWPENVTTDVHCATQGNTPCLLSRWEHDELNFYALDPLHGLGAKLASTRMMFPSFLDWAISADGHSLAIASQDQLPEKIRILDIPGGGERSIPLEHGWKIWHLKWAADRKGLFAAAQTSGYLLARIDPDGTTHTLLDRGRAQWLSYIAPSPNGQSLAFSQRTSESNAWLLEDF